MSDICVCTHPLSEHRKPSKITSRRPCDSCGCFNFVPDDNDGLKAPWEVEDGETI